MLDPDELSMQALNVRGQSLTTAELLSKLTGVITEPVMSRDEAMCRATGL